MLLGDPRRAQAGPHPDGLGEAGLRRLAPDRGGEAVEPGDLVVGREIGIVGHIVDRAGIGIEHGDMRPKCRRQQEGADGEILVARAFAGRRFDIHFGGDLRHQSHPASRNQLIASLSASFAGLAV